MSNPTCPQCDCVAGCQSRERLCPKVDQPDAAYQEAVSLAKALFKKHYSNDHDYANGRVIWGVLDTTAGVISQIDNMVDGLSRKLSTIARPLQQAIDPKCPVCNCPPVFSFDVRVNEWESLCKHCNVSGQSAATKAEAMQKWAVQHPKPAIAQPLQQTEQNFCARCGKRLTRDGIHTCTPPKPTL